MKFQVEVYHHFHGEVEIRSLLATLITQGRRIMSSLEELHVKADALLAKVEAEKTIENSLITLLAAMVTNNRKLAEDLATAIANADPAAIQAVADHLDEDATLLDANIETLSAALVANTPAA